MAATVNQIINMLWSRQKTASLGLGSYLGSMPKETRVVIKVLDATLAVMHQALVDHGVYTDAELQQRIDAAVAGVFAEEPEARDPVPPDPVVPPSP